MSQKNIKTENIEQQEIKHESDLSKYEFKNTIGQGNFGKVKLAIYLPTNEKVAIKILNKETIDDKNEMHLVKRELNIIKTFTHINVIKVSSIIEEELSGKDLKIEMPVKKQVEEEPVSDTLTLNDNTEESLSIEEPESLSIEEPESLSFGEELYEIFKASDIGDIIGIEGELVKTDSGELSVKAHTYTHLSKALRPLPEKFHGLTDVEERYRRRYVDLIMNEDSKRIALLRPKIIRAIQHYLDGQGLVEVETPVLQPILGGAAARPFVTHHNTLDMDFYLRIATLLIRFSQRSIMPYISL